MNVFHIEVIRGDGIGNGILGEDRRLLDGVSDARVKGLVAGF